MKSMNIIYLDTLFLVNFICDYILLLCTARVSGVEIRRKFIAAAAILGALYACLCTTNHAVWLQLPLIQSSCSILLCIISFGNVKSLLRCTVIFLCLSAMVGGVLSALSINTQGIMYLPIDLKTTFLIFTVVYLILSLLFRSFPKLQQKEYHNIIIKMNGTSVRLKALRDTGNELFDPITNLPVIICDTTTLQPLFAEIPVFFEDPYDSFIILNRSEKWENKMKLIPYQTISTSGILLGFKPDELWIDNIKEQFIVAFAPKQFKASDTYQAIL